MKTTRIIALVATVAILQVGCASSSASSTESSTADEVAGTETPSESKESAGSAERDPAPTGPNAPALYATGPIATVDGTPISAETFNQAFERRAGALGGKMPPHMVHMMKKRMVDRLIEKRLLDRELSRVGASVRVSPREVNAELDDFIARFPDENAYDQFLKRQGITSDELRENIRKDLKLKKVLERKYGTRVTRADARKYYDSNPLRFEKKAQVRARHILIKTKKDASAAEVDEARARAEDISRKAKQSGAGFAELAKEHSEGPSAKRGGDLGWFTKARMVPEFSEAAFKMQPGEVSEPVRTQFGFHVIKVEGRKPAGKTPFAEAEPKIIRQLERQKFQRATQKLLSRLEANATIERHADNIQVNVDEAAAKKRQKQLKLKLQKKLQQRQQN